VLSIDIGGGSAEIVVGNNKKIDNAESLPLGVARVADRFISKDPPSKDNLRSLVNHIEDMMRDTVDLYLRKGFSRAIGTGGTLINLASLVYEAREGRELRLRGYFEVKRKELEKLSRKLVRLPKRKLKKLPGLDKKRDDIITAGVILAITLMRLLKMNSILVSDKGVREGMILDHILRSRFKVKNPPPNLRVQWFGQKPYFSGRIIR
jgi:exopolyphosphatase/guanosine-5'-triphosphate,3'-diphosphate pyrophosphatase